RLLLAATGGPVTNELSRDPADELVASASRHADTVAEPATDEWWAALFADLDARLAAEGTNHHRSGDDAERRVLTQAALGRLALSREPPPPTIFAEPDPTVGVEQADAPFHTDTSRKPAKA